MRSQYFFLLMLLLTEGCVSLSDSKSNIDKRYVVMLSLDGFRWDYTQLYNTPVLDSIAKNGCKASSLIPCFPSKTFPNHYSIATGLYPDHHGLINNSFYNTWVNRAYKVSDRSSVEDPRFYGGEPIWVTAQKQGIKTASYYWVGSETKIKGIQPDIWKQFDSRVSFEARIDSVITWLELPIKQRPRLITFYFEQPDKVGHESGPESDQTKRVVERLDSLLGIFCSKKNKLSIADSIDFMIVSDHGMAAISKEKAIALNDYISADKIESCYGNNPFFLIEPRKMYEDLVYSVLTNQEGLNVWRKNEIPDTLHYGKNEIIPSLVVCAKPGWGLYKDASDFCNGGTHGYVPNYSDMHAIFFAIGPSFKKDYTHKSFANIEIYNLVCRLLNLKPSPNDGDFSNISSLLRNK
jgi:predicted AlkP superfamily pyrophosphatase or phosphodiesterase